MSKEGFFSASELPGRRPLDLVPRCGQCGLLHHCDSPKMKVHGRGDRKILLVGESPGCLGGESLVEVAYRDKGTYPNGIPIKELVGESGFFVYSFDVDSQMIKLGRVKRVWCTGVKKTYRVIYEWRYNNIHNGEVTKVRESLVVTAKHPFLIRKRRRKDPFNGLGEERTYVSIDQGLMEGHSLQPFYRREEEGYYYIGAFSTKMLREGRFLLSQNIGRELIKGEDCHHINERKDDDRIDNLELLTTAEHARFHTQEINPLERPGAREKHAKAMQSKEYKEEQSRRQKDFLSDQEEYTKRINSIVNSNPARSETVKNKYREPGFFYRFLRGRQKCFGWSDQEVIRRFAEKFPDEPLPDDNHLVISIEPLEEDKVYDMEVEQYHNFAVNGIFVHNSEEDRCGIPFVGFTGGVLRQTLGEVGIDMERDCWITNAAICFPKDADGRYRAPTDKELEYCRPNLVKVVEELDPDVIVPLGGSAVSSVMGWLWREDPGPVSRWVGWTIPCQRPNVWICPTWHPSFVSRQVRGDSTDPVVGLFFRKHLERIARIERKPWNKPPDFRKRVRVIQNSEAAWREIRRMFYDSLDSGIPLAFDFETDRLKPDAPESEIVCCSLSDGETSLAFPWQGDAITAMVEVLESDVPKIGFNTAFEERWWRRHFGVGVNNWVWDGMIQAHLLDNRPGISGLKFQSWVLLGQDAYDLPLKPYLEAAGGNVPNRIREAGLESLLLYCGLDSLLEWKVAARQAKILRRSLV